MHRTTITSDEAKILNALPLPVNKVPVNFRKEMMAHRFAEYAPLNRNNPTNVLIITRRGQSALSKAS